MDFDSGENSPKVYYLQPLEDLRWADLLERHPRASIFHSVAWLEALHRTYGYETRVVTTSPPDAPLQNGIVFCRVNSWLTGRRLVSLPSSDHCEALLTDPSELCVLFGEMEKELREKGLKYLDFRFKEAPALRTSLLRSTEPFRFHELDLRSDLTAIFANCHKSSMQRKIRRAEREGLVYRKGNSDAMLNSFLQLHALTRRRHKIPPQPKKWFRNLIQCFGGDLTIRVAFQRERPVAATLSLCYKNAMVYKYGCSNAEYNKLGGMPFLIWKMIEEGKHQGLDCLDLGRSDMDDQGLINFKNHTGAVMSTLFYSRFAVSRKALGMNRFSGIHWKDRLNRHLLSHLPEQALYLVGHLLYRHVG
jgi:CelD/BcsL family acetyltransferase involved in cellulose biosynthesis